MSNLPLLLPVIWLAVLSPGADFAMVSRLSCVDGRRSGLLAALGIALGCWCHVAFAIFGLGVIARVFPPFLILLKLAGAAYLIWLGVAMMTAAPAGLANDRAPPLPRVRRAFATGLLTNALNPKTSLFVVSLYAQAIGPRGPLTAKLGYGAVISLSHLAWFAGVAVFLSRPATRAWVRARERAINRALGGVLLLLGVALGLADVGGAR